MLNHLEKIDEFSNSVNIHHRKLLELVGNFEDRYDLPVGINVDLDNFDEMKVGVINVRVIGKCRDLFEEKFHSGFMKFLDVKLFKIVEERVIFNSGERIIFTYKYTYSSNVRFDGIIL